MVHRHRKRLLTCNPKASAFSTRIQRNPFLPVNSISFYPEVSWKSLALPARTTLSATPMAASAENYLAVCTQVLLTGLKQERANRMHTLTKPGPVCEVNSLSDNTPGEQEGIFSYLGKGLFRFSQQKALYSLSGAPRQHFFLGTWLSLPKRPLKNE